MEATETIYCERLNDKQKVVEYFYDREEVDFFKSIHKRAGTRQECIDDSVNSIDEGTELWGVFDKAKLVAYFGKYREGDQQSLNGFHVLKEYRTMYFLDGFWEIVKSKFESTIYTGIYVRNEPAIRSLMKAGFGLHKLVEHDNKVFLILKF